MRDGDSVHVGDSVIGNALLSLQGIAVQSNWDVNMIVEVTVTVLGSIRGDETAVVVF